MNAPDYLARLRQENEKQTRPDGTAQTEKTGLRSLCSSPKAQKNSLFSDDASRLWLLHYPDREPVETWTDPPATHADILERHPEAIAAEPINLATPEPARACSTCAHACRSGCCGEPVAAGLSDVVGVIRYSPDQGTTCPAWLATLPGDLERRILAMAERWGCSGDELAAALAGARTDPGGWHKVVEADEKEGGE